MSHSGKCILAVATAYIVFLVSNSIAQDNSDTGAPSATAHFHVDGQYALSE